MQSCFYQASCLGQSLPFAYSLWWCFLDLLLFVDFCQPSFKAHEILYSSSIQWLNISIHIRKQACEQTTTSWSKHTMFKLISEHYTTSLSVRQNVKRAKSIQGPYSINIDMILEHIIWYDRIPKAQFARNHQGLESGNMDQSSYLFVVYHGRWYMSWLRTIYARMCVSTSKLCVDVFVNGNIHVIKFSLCVRLYVLVNVLYMCFMLWCEYVCIWASCI